MSSRWMVLGLWAVAACSARRAPASDVPQPDASAPSSQTLASAPEPAATPSADPSPPASGDAEGAEAVPGATPPGDSEDGESPSGETPTESTSDSAEAMSPSPEPAVFAPGGVTLEVTRRVRTGVQPKSIAMSPSGDRLYVCNFGLNGRRNVWVYETENLQKVGRIDFAGNAAEATVSADGATVYVSNFGRSRIEVVDAQSLEVTAQIKVGSNPKFMVIDEERQILYVSNWSSRSVSAVDLTTQRVDHTLRTGRRPRGLALRADGTLFVGAMWDHVVQVYAPGSKTPDRQFDACENPRHLMLSPDQSRLYVSCSGDQILRWFDPQTGEVLGEAPTGQNPRTIGVSPDGRFIAIADFNSSTVSLVDVVDRRHRTHEIERSKQIVGLAVAPEPALRVFATSWLSNELYEMRPTSAAVAVVD